MLICVYRIPLKRFSERPSARSVVIIIASCRKKGGILPKRVSLVAMLSTSRVTWLPRALHANPIFPLAVSPPRAARSVPGAFHGEIGK